ncbi:MAG: hypothetical protein Q8M16_13560 [Pirellulaceae bacterium]|nr:hypothetical protein [Pirellulaceae bacterium]
MNHRTPTEEDWRGTFLEVLWDYFCHGSIRTELGLDGESAYREFFGKTHDEAVQIFRDCAESRIYDLYWMPTKRHVARSLTIRRAGRRDSCAQPAACSEKPNDPPSRSAGFLRAASGM